MPEQYTPAVSEGAFALQMVEKYRQLLLDNSGLTQVMIDGQAVSYADLEKKYEQWAAKLGKINGTRPVIASITLGDG